ncbi:MAG: hypothetical protein PHD37_02830 [Gallionellaceae bacterium]|nr:hypothetical protein [Gallionellaceae bacterium]
MAIGALSASPAISYFPGATALDGAADRVRQTPRESSGTHRGQAGTQSTATDSTRNSAAETARKAVRENLDVEKTQASTLNSNPRVQFKDSEGTRVMEVYDSKNVLIYQVPPKGLLTLIHSQEHRPNPQVETSA